MSQMNGGGGVKVVNSRLRLRKTHSNKTQGFSRPAGELMEHHDQAAAPAMRSMVGE